MGDDGKPPGISGLNGNHLRSIFVTLRLLEEDIDRLEKYMKNPPCGRTYEIVNDLGPQREKAMMEKLEALKRRLCAFADETGVGAERESLARMMRGSLALRWEDVCELEAARMARYGKVGERGAEVLNAFAREIELLLGELLEELKDGGEKSRCGGGL